jgi:DNA-binding MarR family transcriptional regulator
MSWRLVDDVRDNAPRDLSPTHRAALLVLASRAHERDRHVRKYPVARIAWDVGITTRQAARILDDLEDRGLIVRTIDPATLRRGMCQTYYLPPLEEHHRHAIKGPIRGTDPDAPR